MSGLSRHERDLRALVTEAREISRSNPDWTAQQCVSRARYLRDEKLQADRDEQDYLRSHDDRDA